MEHRELAAKIVCVLYSAFNALVAFPRVLSGMAPGTGLCNAAWVLRYCNAQPLLTSNVVSMVSCCSLSRRCIATQQSGYIIANGRVLLREQHCCVTASE